MAQPVGRRSLKRKAAEMETPANQATAVALEFLSLPGEIRNRIYRLLFRLDSTIDDDCRPRLSAQFLRTCRQVRDEGLPILYGENTFGFEMNNTAGPFYQTYLAPMPFERRTETRASRYHIVVTYTEEHKIELIRNAVRRLVNEVLAKGIQIDFIHLECDLDAEGDDDNFDRRHPFADDYWVNDGGKHEVVGVLRTWLGQVRNVKEVKIEGLEKDDAALLRRRLQSDEIMGATLLTDMYTALESQVKETAFCEGNLRKALLAIESDDMEGFKEASVAVAEALKERLEGVKNVIRQFAEGDESMDVDVDGDTKEAKSGEGSSSE
ncbi:hypothetical protein QBC40DRAFT_269890 [Triangularia verruculosa]|uniref:Uncharacterized protein n=1 Tax=Triangularia verruculosa TaxID=2587418 RepID=A0AAN6X5X9_9PEZI|nr:hypothetical protein QBC40DRAFT_269890 [Triangularia verruculosa]